MKKMFSAIEGQNKESCPYRTHRNGGWNKLFRGVKNIWESFYNIWRMPSWKRQLAVSSATLWESIMTSAVKRSIGFTIGFQNHGEGPSPGWKRLLALSHLRHYANQPALVGAFSVIVQLHRLIVYSTNYDRTFSEFCDCRSFVSLLAARRGWESLKLMVWCTHWI